MNNKNSEAHSFIFIFVKNQIQMRLIVPLLFIIIFITAIDLYLFKALKLFCRNLKNKKIRRAIFITHWTIPLISICIYFFINYKVADIRNPKYYVYLFNTFGIFILIYFPKIIFTIFHLIEDIVYLIKRLITKNKSRFLFISKIGFAISVIPFILIILGTYWGKYNYQIRKEKIVFSNLPESFNKIKILQISDFHIGSFGGDTIELKKIIKLINQQKADYVFFTGDMVNNFAEELNGVENILLSIQAKYGKYAILGNHDYGDYYKWKSETDKKNNFLLLKKKINEAGFTLLLNNFTNLKIKNDSIALIGVENWGKPPFKQYGNIEKAKLGTEKYLFKILLSHDPDYWKTSIVRKTNIDFTLSGHTHGMQIGFELNSQRYSPAKIRFKEWGGLYKEQNQYLYVNTGIGFIGLPARIGILPEITVIELLKKQ